MGTHQDRRNVRRRAQVIQRAIAEVVQGPLTTITLDTLEIRLGVARDAADRIVRRLVCSGVLRETRHGLWERVEWVAAHQGR